MKLPSRFFPAPGIRFRLFPLRFIRLSHPDLSHPDFSDAIHTSFRLRPLHRHMKNAVFVKRSCGQPDSPLSAKPVKALGKRGLKSFLCITSLLQPRLLHLRFNPLHFLFIFRQSFRKNGLRVKTAQGKQRQGQLGENHDADDDPRIFFITSLRQETQNHLSGEQKNGDVFDQFNKMASQNRSPLSFTAACPNCSPARFFLFLAERCPNGAFPPGR